MTEIWTRRDYRKLLAQRRQKYNAKPQVVDGMRFDSQAEAEYYQHNKLRIEAGDLSYQLRQVPFHLPGKTIYRVDFLEVSPDGDVRYVDIKGVETSEFKLKKRMVEDLYPVRIECMKKVGKRFVRKDE